MIHNRTCHAFKCNLEDDANSHNIIIILQTMFSYKYACIVEFHAVTFSRAQSANWLAQANVTLLA